MCLLCGMRLEPRRPGLDTGTFDTRYVVDKVTLEEFFFLRVPQLYSQCDPTSEAYFSP